MVDLRRAEARTALGVEPRVLTGTRARAQRAAEHAKELGAQGMVVPSAARPDAWNLVVFPDGLSHVTVGPGRAVHPRPPADSVRREGGG